MSKPKGTPKPEMVAHPMVNKHQSPTVARKPLGYGTRTHRLSAPSPVPAAAKGEHPLKARRRADQVMYPPLRARKGDKKALALLKTFSAVKGPRARPDYFGTDEHSAAAYFLKQILAGSNPYAGTKQVLQVANPSHVLLGRKSAAGPLGKAPIAFDDLEVRDGNAWRGEMQERLGKTIEQYQPTMELDVAPGLSLRYGEIVALAGDYYQDPAQLRAELTPEVVEAIREVTPKDDGTFMLGVHRGLVDYFKLAYDNFDHFSPRNWMRYGKVHGEALKLALDRDLEGALVRNAFADHFVTDAFASGHARVPRAKLSGLKGALPSRQMHNEDNEQGLWFENLEGHVWHGYGDGHLGTNPIHLMITTFALGLSLQRIYKAYRLEGAEAAALSDAIDAAKLKDLSPGQLAQPSDLPDFLGAVSGLDDLRQVLPVAVQSRAAASGTSLCNFPPMYALDGTRRSATPDFGSFFKAPS